MDKVGEIKLLVGPDSTADICSIYSQRKKKCVILLQSLALHNVIMEKIKLQKGLPFSPIIFNNNRNEEEGNSLQFIP